MVVREKIVLDYDDQVVVAVVIVTREDDEHARVYQRRRWN